MILLFIYRLVYTTAFLLEVQRYFTIVPIAGPRRVLEDVVMDGYSIPKDTTILIGVGDVHFDPKIWANPDKFIPERFIDDQGNIKNTEHMFPFGSGEFNRFLKKTILQFHTILFYNTS